MRSKKTLINIVMTMLYFLISNLFNFITKSIFIKYLGIEYSGLNAFLLNIIGVLNLAELGISSSVGYALYKPLKDKDYQTISEIICLFKKLYHIIGCFVFGAGIILSFFLEHLVTTDIPIGNIRIYFFLYLFSVLTSYFLTYTNVLPSSNQENYLVVRIQGNIKIIKNIVELIVIFYFKNYYVWLWTEIIGNCLSYIICNIKIKRRYCNVDFTVKGLRTKSLLNKYTQIVKNIKNLFYHQIGSLIVNQTDNIIISKFCNLIVVGKYTNYIYIYSMLTGCVDQIFNSITGSIGNLIVEDEGQEKSYNVWKCMYAMTFMCATCAAYLFYILSYSFIVLWVGKNTLANSVVFCIALNIFFRIIKAPTERFKTAYGIFYDKYAPLMEALINLIFSIILVKFFDVLGVVMGTVISNVIIIYLWKPYITFRDGFKKKFKEYVKISLELLCCSVFSIFFTNMALSRIHFDGLAWKSFIYMTVIDGCLAFLIMLAVFSVNNLFRQSEKEMYARLRRIIKR